MSSYLTSKCAGLLSNIPSKQTALWTADINLSKCCEKVFGLGAAKSREERKRGQISQLEFSFVFTSKASLRCFAAWASQTCSPRPQVPHMRLRFVPHTCTPSTLSDFEGFLWVSTYPRWSVLYPSTGHFLLVDDVHQFDGVVALHVNHRPLQGILSNLVELKRRRRKKTRETQASCFLTKLDRFCNFDMKAVVFKRDLLCTAKVLNNAVCLCRTPHLQVFLWPCMSTDAPATFFLQRAANQNKAG